MQFLKISLLFIMLWGVVNSAHAVLTCTLTQSSGSDSAIGTITVSKIGTLAPADFTNWNITVTALGGSSVLNSANSSISLGNALPSTTMVSTTNSLTITVTDPANFTSGNYSRFAIAASGSDLDEMGPGEFYSLQTYFGGTNADMGFASNAGTASAGGYPFVLTLPCINSTPVSAPIDFSFNHKQPQTYSEEIIIK